jgi:hypothetical protein
MAIPTSAIALSSIQAEFGGVDPISLSEYYSTAPGGGFVRPEVTAVPASGTISMGDFAGTSQPLPTSSKIGIVQDGFIFKGGPLDKFLVADVSVTGNPNVGGPLRNRYFNVSSSLYNKRIITWKQEFNGNFQFSVSSAVTTTAGVFTSIRTTNPLGTFSINRSSMSQVKSSNRMFFSLSAVTNDFLFNVTSGTSVIVCIN